MTISELCAEEMRNREMTHFNGQRIIRKSVILLHYTVGHLMIYAQLCILLLAKNNCYQPCENRIPV